MYEMDQSKPGAGSPEKRVEEGRSPAWKWAWGMAILCGLGAGGLYGLVFHVVPGLSLARQRPPMFWETLQVQVWFVAYLAGAFAIASLCLKNRWTKSWSTSTLVVLALGLAMAVRWATPDMALDFAPRPDALHYSALAARLVSAGQWTIPVGPHELPSRFSPATSLLLAATQWIRADHLGMGIWSIWISGGVAIALVGVVGARAFSRRVGLVAALLLASSPAYGHYTRHLMSEVPWSLSILLALAGIYLARDRGVVLFAGGFLLAFGMLFKPPHVAVVAGTGLSYLIHMMRHPDKRCRNALWIGVGFVSGILPWFLYNRWVLGAWLTSGYQIFGSNRLAVDAAFGWQYLFRPPLEKGFMGNLLYYPLTLLGLEPRMSRMLFALPTAGLVLAGLQDRFRTRSLNVPISDEARGVLRGCACAVSAYVGMFMVFAWQDSRYLLPILPLGCLGLAYLIDPFIQRIGAKGRRGLLGLMVLILVAMAAAILHVELQGQRLHNHATWSRLPAVLADYDVLVTDEDPVALGFYRIWTTHRPVVPALSTGTDWFEADPSETRRRTGTYQTPYAGLEIALKPYLDSGQRIAVWLVFPRAHRALLDSLPPEYELKPWAADIPNGYELIRNSAARSEVAP